MAKKKSKAIKELAGHYVIVTTEWRGVFFGRLAQPEDYERNERRIVLYSVRNVIRWEGNRGFLGLAAHGPEKGSLIGSEASRIELHGVTSVADCAKGSTRAFDALGGKS